MCIIQSNAPTKRYFPALAIDLIEPPTAWKLLRTFSDPSMPPREITCPSQHPMFKCMSVVEKTINIIIQMSYQYMFKYIIIGDTCVGKSCLLLQFLENKFKFDHDTTIGVEFGSKVTSVKGTSLKLQVWDTAGQETYKSITRSYYRGSIGVILVYDVTNRQSFENIEKWLEETKNFANDKVSIILVGNKTDLQDKKCISTQQGKKLASDRGILFVQSSAKTGENVDKVFLSLAQNVLRKIDNKQIDPTNESFGVKLSEQAANKYNANNSKRGYCC